MKPDGIDDYRIGIATESKIPEIHPEKTRESTQNYRLEGTMERERTFLNGVQVIIITLNI
jgi:hypothetical protein